MLYDFVSFRDFADLMMDVMKITNRRLASITNRHFLLYPELHFISDIFATTITLAQFKPVPSLSR
jgi:hypothetical protein